MVGPAGMGKTTTLAKLAARYVLKYGAQNIALVSMDSFRIGAQEQLKTLGRILNVPVTHVDPGQSLVQALDPLLRKRVVLIDTAGLQASDPALRMQLESLAGRASNRKLSGAGNHQPETGANRRLPQLQALRAGRLHPD
jgi:flagellar biosynthesis protein FlhF